MLSGLIHVGEVVDLRIEQIRLDGGTQPRVGIDSATVRDYEEDMLEGASFPPVDVMYDGTHYWLWDGFHRVSAARRIGQETIPARVLQGTQADAQWASYGVNKAHGLRRTQADKRRQIEAALRHPQGVSQSNSAIARHCGVSDKTVEDVRKGLEATSEIRSQTQRTGLDGRTIQTGGIGGTRKRQAPRPTYGRCGVCGRELTDPDSAARGVGPCCAAKQVGSNGGDVDAGEERPLPSWAVETTEAPTEAEIEAILRAEMAAAVPADNANKRYDWMVATPAYDVATIHGWPHAPTYAARNLIIRELIHQRVAQRGPFADAPAEAEPVASVATSSLAERYQQRAAKLLYLREQYDATLLTLDEFGELTGHHVMTLAVKRGLREMIQTINANLVGDGEETGQEEL